MRKRRGLEPLHELCSGPGKLTQALGIWLDLNGSSLLGQGAIEVLPPTDGERPRRIVIGERVGINRATELPWRFCDPRSRSVSRPWPAEMRSERARRAVVRR
jgi:DNA-3-methyladenine glycosylase